MSISLKRPGEMPTAGYLPQRAYTALFFKCDGYSNALEVIRFLRQKKKNEIMKNSLFV